MVDSAPLAKSFYANLSTAIVMPFPALNFDAAKREALRAVRDVDLTGVQAVGEDAVRFYRGFSQSLSMPAPRNGVAVFRTRLPEHSVPMRTDACECFTGRRAYTLPPSAPATRRHGASDRSIGQPSPIYVHAFNLQSRERLRSYTA